MTVHFFANPDNILQYQSQQYGPLNEEDYRTTAAFTINSDTAAYAVTAGQFLFFDNIGDTALINLVLRTTDTCPYGLTPKVKYFVYRGLRRDDYMTMVNGVYQIRPLSYAQQQNIELLIYLYNINGNLSLTDIYYDQPGAENIHNILSRAQKCYLKKGLKVGYFKKMPTLSPGFEVVLDTLYFNSDSLNVAYATAVEHTIHVDFDASYSPGNEPRSTLAVREKIHGFMDPAVFWGLTVISGIEYQGLSYSIQQNSQDLYNKFINPFATKDHLYLDIRNGLDYSLNYFKDQESGGNHIATNYNHKQIDTAVFTNVSYYTDYWPIKILNISPFGSNNHVLLNLQFINQNFSKPLIYLDYSIISKSCKWNQGYANGSVISTFSLASTGQFQFMSSQQVQLIQPCITVGSTHYKIPWFSRLYYFDGNINATLNRYYKTPFDYIFGGITENGIGQYLYNSTSAEMYNNSEVWTAYNQRKICVPRGRGIDYPLVVQTGIGLSASSVIFYGKVIAEEYSSELPSNDSFLSILPGHSTVDTNQKTPWYSYGKYQTSSWGIIFQKRSLSGRTFQLHLSSQEVFNIQARIKQYSNTNLPNPPFATDLNVNNRELRFVFNIFQNSSDDNYYFGEANINIAGMDHSGNEVLITDLQIPTAVLFINTSDWINFSSLSISDQLAGIKDLTDEYPFPEFPTSILNSILKELTDNFINYVDDEILLGPVPFYLCERFISTWRRYYYGAQDYSPGATRWVSRNFLHFEPFEMAIPHAPGGMLERLDKYIRGSFGLKLYLFSRANENSLRDNPSPYIIDPSNKRIDLGHLLYGLDGLIHDYADTHEHFKKLSILKSNDFTGYIADFVPPAAEARLYDHGFQDRFEGFYYPVTKDIDRIYEISAPAADLYSDVDAFGMYKLYRYFKNNPSSELLPVVKGERMLTLEFLFKYYFNDAFNLNDPVNFPTDANYKLRWLNFCRGYGVDGNTIDNPSPNGEELVYQGFIEKKPATGKFEWVADNSNTDGTEHQSKRKLRVRAENFAHFWYQINYDKNAIAGVLHDGNYSDNTFIAGFIKKFPDLLKNSASKPIRFEQQSKGTLIEDLCKYIEEQTTACPTNFPTDPSETNYVINKFLAFVKSEFQNEKAQMGY